MSTASSEYQSPDTIETNIEQTRTEMGQTIDAIQERLSPQRLTSDVAETMIGITNEVTSQVRTSLDATLRDVSDFVSRTLEQNPIASMFANIGYVISMRRSTMSGAANMLPENMQSTLSNTAQQVQDTTSQVHEQAMQYSNQAQMQVTHARNRVEQVIQDNPLLVGALAVAAGVAVGLAIPISQQENRLLGDTHDQLAQRVQSQAQQTAQEAQQIAKDTVHRVQAVAEEAKEAAIQEAQDQGLIGSSQSNQSPSTSANG
jgi:ElaB/YqjD/DUF883 family membrane-anchored ribosome-binding protein